MFRTSEAVPAELRVDAARLSPPTEEEIKHWARDKRVFLSSVMSLRDERHAAIDAIQSLGATAVAWELITPTPVPAREAWLGGVNSSHALALLLSKEYGVRQSDGFSATHREFLRAEEIGLDRWVFLDSQAEPGSRDGHLESWLEELRSLYSYGSYHTPEDLYDALRRSLADLAAVQLYTWFKLGQFVVRADSHRLRAPDAEWSPSASGELTVEGHVTDADIRAGMSKLASTHQSTPLAIGGQLFEASVTQFEERSERGFQRYAATLRLEAPRLVNGILRGSYSANGKTWTVEDQAQIAAAQILGLPSQEAPLGQRPAIQWRDVVERAGRIPALVSVVGALIATEALVRGGAIDRLTMFEARMAGPPTKLVLRAAGAVTAGFGVETKMVQVTGDVDVH